MLDLSRSALSVSFTVGHTSSTPFTTAFDALYETKNEFHKGGSWTRFRERHGIVGSNLLVEFTYSPESGPHAHFHGFIYLNQEHSPESAQRLMSDLTERWVYSANRNGYEASTGSQKLRLVPAHSRAKLAGYLSKDHAAYRWRKVDKLTGEVRETIGSIRHRAVQLDPEARALYDELVHATAGRHRTATTRNLLERLKNEK